MTAYELQMKLLDLEKQGYTMDLQAKQCHFSIEYHPSYNAWILSVKMYVERYLRDHPLYKNIFGLLSNQWIDVGNLLNYLHEIGSDNEYWQGSKQNESVVNNVINATASNPLLVNGPFQHFPNTDTRIAMNNGMDVEKREKVFIVHGHDNAAKEEMARTLEKLGFEAVILHEQPDSGKTIIEKIERYTDVVYGVVLYTECDKGRDKNDPVEEERYRARQNVVFEHGYLIAKLTRERVCAFVKGNVETPGDISGVVYTPMDAPGAWKQSLVKNMRDVGLDVDINKII